jgi:hypothetical protein
LVDPLLARTFSSKLIVSALRRTEGQHLRDWTATLTAECTH